MMWGLLALGFVLSLDNVRVSVVLGTVPISVRRAVQVALTFGLWDGVMPLLGLLVGRYLNESFGSLAGYVGSAALGGYGLYLVVSALRDPEPGSWIIPGRCSAFRSRSAWTTCWPARALGCSDSRPGSRPPRSAPSRQ